MKYEIKQRQTRAYLLTMGGHTVRIYNVLPKPVRLGCLHNVLLHACHICVCDGAVCGYSEVHHHTAGGEAHAADVTVQEAEDGQDL